MRIQAIRQLNYFKLQNRNNPCLNTPVAYDSLEINFKGIAQRKLKLQALLLEKEAHRAHKNASEIHKDSIAILQEGSQLKAEATSILQESKKELKEVLKLLKQGQLENHKPVYDSQTGEIIREYVDGTEDEDENNDAFIMWEYDEDGNPTRKTVVEDCLIKIVIPDYYAKDSKVYIFDKIGSELINYIENISIKGDSYSADKQYTYSDSKLATYNENYKYQKGKGESSQEHYSFSGSNLKTYCTEWSLDEDEKTEKAYERFEYRGSKLAKAFVDYEDASEEYKKAQQSYTFVKDSGFRSYTKKLYTPYKKEEIATRNKYFIFGDEGLEKIYLDVKISPQEKKISASQLFTCENDKTKECKYDYTYTSKKKETYSKKVNIEE